MTNTRAEQLKIVAQYAGAKVTTPYPFNKDLGYETYHFEYPLDREDPLSYPENKRFHTISSLKYDTSFDWLMPVAIKLCADLKEKGLRFNNNYYFELASEVHKAMLQPISSGVLFDLVTSYCHLSKIY